MPFFVYYVLCPVGLGAGFYFTALAAPSLTLPLVVIWWVLWMLPPFGTARRQYMEDRLQELQKEAEKSRVDVRPYGYFLALGPLLVLFLAFQVGMAMAPIYMETILGIDVGTRLEEMQNAEDH